MNEHSFRAGHSRSRIALLALATLVVASTVVGSAGWPASSMSVPAPAPGSAGTGPAGAPAAPVVAQPPIPAPGTTASPTPPGVRAGPIAPDVRTPTLTVSSTSGPVGTKVTFNATEYADLSTFTLVWTNGTHNGATICTGKDSSTGSFSCTFTIPAIPNGSHVFTGSDAVGHMNTATFSVTPSLSVNPATGLVGTPVTFSGQGYDSNTTVAVTGPQGAACSGKTAAAGSFSCVYVIPHTTARGNLFVGKEPGGTSATAVFTVVPGLSDGPGFGMPGTSITFTGTGFVASGSVTVSGPSGAACSSSTSGVGDFSCAYLLPLSTAGGAETFTATDNQSNSATAVFVVTFVTVTPSSGDIGTTVNFTGGGFTPSTPFSLSWAAGTIDSGTTSPTGSFAFSYAIPPSVARGHLFTATDRNGLSANTTFIVIPLVTVLPDGGPAGTVVNFTGTGFNGSSPVAVTWGAGAACPSTSTTTDATGGFHCTYTIPATVAGGVYTFTATDASSNTATTTYTVTYLSASPASGPVGSSVTLTGGGYSPGAHLAITWVGVSACSTIVTSTGSFSCPAFKIPYTTAGAHLFTASDGVGDSATASFTVTAQILVSPSSDHGPVNTTVTFSGSGFAGSSPLTVMWAGGSACSGVTTGATGGFNCSFSIPPTHGGSYTFLAKDGSGNSATVPFTVTAQLKVSPSSGPVGTVVRFNASGFANSSSLSITYPGGSACNGMTATTGSFACTFTIPPAAASITFVATDGSSDTASTAFTLTSALTASPTSGPIGTVVTFNGTGFGYSGSGLSVSVTWAKGTACTGTTSSIGNFSCAFTIPAGTVGSRTPYTFNATDSFTRASVGFEVTPRLGVSPSSAAYNQSVLFTGSGFSMDSQVAVTWNGGAAACNATTSALGTFNCTYVIGVATVGAHTFTATDSAGLSASTPFTVSSEVAASPASGAPGTAVRFTGHGFDVGAVVNVTWSGGTACAGTADGTGSFSCTFTIPAVAAGAHPFKASEGSNHATTTFTVVPAITVAPGTGHVGTSVTFHGTGYGVNATVYVNWSEGTACSGAANGVGTFQCTFTVPPTTVGAHTFTGADSSGNRATTSFSVGTTLTADPASGPVGTVVHFVGQGFSGPSVTVTVSWTHGNACSGSTAANGTFDCAFTIPSQTAGGTFLFTATDPEADSASTSFFVTPVLTANPSSGEPGTPLEFQGVGYTGGEKVNVTWSSGLACSGTANATGAFSCNYTIPLATAGGAYTFTGKDQSSHTANTTFVVTFLDAGTVSGAVGTSIAFTAGGYAATSNFTITWNEGTACAGKTNGTGAFACTFVVPAATSGPHVFTGKDGASRSATATFTVVAALTVFPAKGPIGSSLEFNATGYTAGDVVTVAWGAGTACQATANASGSTSCSYTILAGTAGGHLFTGSNVAHDSAGATFTVLPSLSATPTSGFPGTSVTFSGTGYGAGLTLSVNWTGGNACSVTVAASGDANCTFAIPSGTAPAVYTFNGTDSAQNHATTPFTVYGLPSVTAPMPSQSGADVAQPIEFSTTASGGSGTYTTYTWSENASGLGCTLANAPTIRCTPTAIGNYTVTVTVTDSRGAVSAAETSAPFVVGNAPEMGPIVANRTSADAGQSVTFSTTEVGGTAPLHYTWTGLPGNCTGTNLTVVCLVTATAGPGAQISVKVVDANDATANVGPFAFVVYPDPSIAGLSANRTSIDLGQSVTFTVMPAGGTQSYHYLWSGLPTNCSGTGQSVTCTPSATGTFSSISVTVTDSNGVKAVPTAPLSFTVNADPTISPVTASRASADVNQSVTFNVTGAGGSGGLSYLWAGYPTGCSPSGDMLVCTEVSGVMAYSVTATVKDSNGFSVPSAPLAFHVYPDPSVGPPTASASAADIGQTPTFSATVLGGAPGTVDYRWSGLPSACAGTGASVPCGPLTSAETYHVTVSVTDSNGATASSSSALTFEVYNDPTVTTPSTTLHHPSVDVGQSVTFSTTPSGGLAPYRYAWTNLPVGCSGTTDSVVCVPTADTPGPVSISVTITDANGQTNTSHGLTFTVYADPVALASESTSSVLQGKSATFSVTVTGGAGGNVYQWVGLPGACGNASQASVTCTVSSTGTFHVSVFVVDQDGGLTNSSVSITVTPAFLGLPAVEGYALLGGILAAVALGAVALVLVLRRRRRRAPAPVEWNAAGTTPPSGGGEAGAAAAGGAEAAAPLDWGPPPETGTPPPPPDWGPPPETGEPASPWGGPPSSPASPWEPPQEPGSGGAEVPSEPTGEVEGAPAAPPSLEGEEPEGPARASSGYPAENEGDEAAYDAESGAPADEPEPGEPTVPSAYPPRARARGLNRGDARTSDAPAAPRRFGMGRPGPGEPDVREFGESAEYAPPRSPHRFLTRASGHRPASTGGDARRRVPPRYPPSDDR
jgi:hypothetical protein